MRSKWMQDSRSSSDCGSYGGLQVRKMCAMVRRKHSRQQLSVHPPSALPTPQPSRPGNDFESKLMSPIQSSPERVLPQFLRLIVISSSSTDDLSSHVFFSPSINSLNHFLERILILQCVCVCVRAILCVCTYAAYRGGPSTQGNKISLRWPVRPQLRRAGLTRDFCGRAAWAALVFP